MSDLDSVHQDRERQEKSEKKERKRQRKAERRQRKESDALAKIKLSSSSSGHTYETEDEAKLRKRKEKKEAKKMQRQRESSAAGQRKISAPAQATTEIGAATSVPSEILEVAEGRKKKKHRKRKDMPGQDTEQSEKPSGTQRNALEAVPVSSTADTSLSFSLEDGSQQSPRKRARVDAPSLLTETSPGTGAGTTRFKTISESEAEIRRRKENLLKEKRHEMDRQQEAREQQEDNTQHKMEKLKEMKKAKREEKEKEHASLKAPAASIAGDEVEKGLQPDLYVNEKTSDSPRKKTAPRVQRAKVQDQISQILAKPDQSAMGAGRSHRAVSEASSSQRSGAQPLSTKAGILEDAQHLSHKEMLVDRLYHSYQLKWLQEERNLKIKTGKFSQWEKEQIDKAIASFESEQGLSHEDFIHWLFADKHEKDDKDLYAEFWKAVTSSLVDRPNRAVRIAVRRSLQPDTKQGAWSSEEMEKLKSAVQANGKNWSAVARAVESRSAEDCRLRWRDFAPNVEEAKKEGRFTEEAKQKLEAAVRKVCRKIDLDPMSPHSQIPWKRVSEEIDGERTPAHCLTKWQAMLKELNGRHDQARWTLDDSNILVSRLAKERHALDRDDFTEVKLSSLRSPDWLMEPVRLLEKWKKLVIKYVSPTADYKTKFRSNLRTVQEALDSSSNGSGSSVRKRKRSSRVEEDLIDTDEEV